MEAKVIAQANLSLGFREFEVFPTLWEEWNPCQIYVMSVGDSE